MVITTCSLDSGDLGTTFTTTQGCVPNYFGERGLGRVKPVIEPVVGHFFNKSPRRGTSALLGYATVSPLIPRLIPPSFGYEYIIDHNPNHD